MVRPQSLLNLPELSEDVNTPQILEAYGIISNHYNYASGLLREDSCDPIRLRLHSQKLLSRTVPLLKALGTKLRNDEWILRVAQDLKSLVDEIDAAVVAASASNGNTAIFRPSTIAMLANPQTNRFITT